MAGLNNEDFRKLMYQPGDQKPGQTNMLNQGQGGPGGARNPSMGMGQHDHGPPHHGNPNHMPWNAPPFNAPPPPYPGAGMSRGPPGVPPPPYPGPRGGGYGMTREGPPGNRPPPPYPGPMGRGGPPINVPPPPYPGRGGEGVVVVGGGGMGPAGPPRGLPPPPPQGGRGGGGGMGGPGGPPQGMGFPPFPPQPFHGGAFPPHAGSGPGRPAAPPEQGAHLRMGPPYGPVVRGQMCWYKEKDGAWVEVEVLAVDGTADPPSYTVSMNGGAVVREAEREKLSVMRPPPEGQAPTEWSEAPPTDRKKVEKVVEWAAFKDEDGEEYYHNSVTGATTWERPAEMGSAGAEGGGKEENKEAEEVYDCPEGVKSVKKVPTTRWCEAVLEDGGGAYFWDVDNGETTWDVPPEVEKYRKEEEERRKNDEARKRFQEQEDRRRTLQREKEAHSAVVQAAAQMMMSNPMMRHQMLGFPPPGAGIPPPGMMMPPGMAPPGMVCVEPGRAAAEAEARREREERMQKERRERAEREEREREEREEKAREEREKKERAARLHKFKLMLLEKNVVPGGNWEKELPKFCFDPRYKQLLDTPSERKAAFEAFTRADVVKYRDEARRAAAESKARALDEARKQLQSGQGLTDETTFDQWWKEQGEGIEGLVKADKKLKALFEETVEPLRTAAKEVAVSLREREKESFLGLLTRDASIGPDSSWTQYRRRLELALERSRGGAEAEAGEVGEGEEVGTGNCNLKALGWDERERVFRDYIQELIEKRRMAKGDGKKDGRDEGGRDGGRDRSDRPDDRPDDRKRSHGGSQREEKHKRKKGNALEVFKEMLKELIDDPTVEWEKAREVLRKDDRYDDCADELSTRERERLCTAHTDKLRSELLSRMADALEAIPGINFLSKYEEAWEGLSGVDDRFKLLKARDRERAFEKWIDAKLDVEKEKLRISLLDVPEVILTLDEKDREQVPKEIAELTQWIAMEGLQSKRREVLWRVHEELLKSKGKSRKLLEIRMADSSKEGKRSKANLASYVDTPK